MFKSGSKKFFRVQNFFGSKTFFGSKFSEGPLLCIVSYYFIYTKSLHRVHRFDSVFIMFAPLLPFKKHGEEYVARTGRCFFAHGGLVPVAESVYIIYETLHRRFESKRTLAIGNPHAVQLRAFLPPITEKS